MLKINEVNNFIREKLKSKIKNDFKNKLIFSEGDLQGRVDFHLRSFFSRYDKNRDWKILNKPFLPEIKKKKSPKRKKRIGCFIDLVLFRKGKPRIAIELKETHWLTEKKLRIDLQKIRKFIKTYKKGKGYIICLIRQEEPPRIKKERDFRTFIVIANVYKQYKKIEQEWKRYTKYRSKK